MGCGDCNFLTELSKLTKFNATGISYQSNLKLKNNKNFNLIAGKVFKKTSTNEIINNFGKIDISTDVFGVLSYTDDLTGDLNKYLRLSKNGSSWYILGANYSKIIITNDNKRLTFINWLKTLDGIKIIEERSDLEKISIHIKVINNKYTIPELTEVHRNNSRPPKTLIAPKHWRLDPQLHNTVLDSANDFKHNGSRDY